MRFIASPRLLMLARLLAFSAFLMLGISDAAITQVAVRPATAGSSLQIAELTFDAQVCIGVQGSGSFRPIYVSPTAIAQSHVEGSVLTIVIDPAQASPCVTETVFTLNLPPLPNGQYTLNIAETRQTLLPTFYANNVVQKTITTSFSVQSVYALPPVVSVYSQAGAQGSLLAADSGWYQVYPTYASDSGLWQPVFYAWTIGFSDVVPDGSGLQRVYALTFNGPSNAVRFFYTIDTKERDTLLASGLFTTAAPSSAFYAVAAAGGVCPTGLTPIYRAYEPKLTLHRYVPVATYRSLFANGWKGDGVAFCTPAGSTSSAVAPN